MQDRCCGTAHHEVDRQFFDRPRSSRSGGGGGGGPSLSHFFHVRRWDKNYSASSSSGIHFTRNQEIRCLVSANIDQSHGQCIANIDRTSSLPIVSSSSMRAVVSTAPANFSFARGK
jgi:hypothetical protein